MNKKSCPVNWENVEKTWNKNWSKPTKEQFHKRLMKSPFIQLS